MAVKYYRPQTTFTLSIVKAQTSSSMPLSLGMPLGDFNMLFCITRGWKSNGEKRKMAGLHKFQFKFRILVYKDYPLPASIIYL